MKYILYFHPKKGTNKYNQLHKLWDIFEEKKVHNNAIIYPFHSTLSGFFETENIQNICRGIEEIFSVNNGFEVEGFKFSDNGPLKTINFKCPEIKEKLDKLQSKFNFIRCPSKNCLHFTLCNQIKESDNIFFKKLISENIDISEWEPMGWNVILWKIDENGIWEIFKVIV